MHCPAFQVSEFGLFDSRIKFPQPNRTLTAPRPVTEYELEFYTADYGSTYIDSRPYPIRRGTFLCAKPGQMRHSSLPFRCYYVHMSTDDPQLEVLLRGLPDFGVLPQLTQVSELFGQLLVLDLSQPAAPLTLQSCVGQLLCLLSSGKTVPQPTAQTELLLRAEQFIQTHLAEPLTLEQVAGAVNLSPFHFHRIFTDFYGCTPGRYIIGCRVAQAKLQLLQEDFSLARIASDCGFSSQSYFCYRFKQLTGQTPLEYRKETLGKMEF